MHKTVLGLTAAVVLAAPAAAQDPAVAVAVVKKAIAAHGGAEALNKTKTGRSKSKGTMTVFGQDIEFVSTSVYSIPEKFKLEMAAEIRGLKLTATQVVNGKQVRVKTVLGGTEQPVTDRVKEETAQAVLVQDVTTLTPLLDGRKFTARAEKDADVDGKPAAVLVVTGSGLRETRLFFDKDSGRLVKTQRKGVTSGPTGVVEVVEESFLSDFKPVDGALLPMKLVVKHDGKKFMDVTVTEVKFLAKVDPDEFATEK